MHTIYPPLAINLVFFFQHLYVKHLILFDVVQVEEVIPSFASRIITVTCGR